MRDVLGLGFTQLQGLSLMSLNLQLFGDYSFISWGLPFSIMFPSGRGSLVLGRCLGVLLYEDRLPSQATSALRLDGGCLVDA